MTDPRWIIAARQRIGMKETPGPGSNSLIKAMWLKLKGGAWYWTHFGSDDSKLPWCGAFVAMTMDECGIAYPKNYASAKAWAEWGERLIGPAYGCIVVFDRAGGGHVGIVVGQDKFGRLLVLGGNQGDAVSVVPFERARAIAYRSPPGEKFIPVTLPLFTSAAASSSNEA
jgi:uncharacterized protein (TIGR02594 family)